MEDKKESYIFYNVVAFLIRNIGHLIFLDQVIGKENIPNEGGCILAGNHTSNFDSILLFRSTKRVIHILGKAELFKGPFGFIFKKMQLISVDRQRRSPEVIRESIRLLKSGEVVGIFPEGTFHKETIILPFKPGVIKMASESHKPIIPFAIVGKFKLFSHPKIIFGKPIYLDQVEENDKLKYLEDTIIKMIKENS